MNARNGSFALGLVLALTFPTLASADDVALFLRFTTDGAVGSPTPFTDTIGHANAVWFILPEFIVDFQELGFPPDGPVHTTSIYSDDPLVVFTGTDAALFNDEMATFLNVPREGRTPQVKLLIEQGGFDGFYVSALPPTSNPYFEAHFNRPTPELEMNSEGFYAPTSFVTTTNRATVFDPRDGLSNVVDNVGSQEAYFGPFIESIVDVEEGDLCPLGGTQLARGIDVDDDETVDVIYDARDLVCNVPPCTVTDNLDGTYTIACVDGGEVTIRDGVDGTNGTDGANGSDCSATDNGDGTYTIVCDDGSEVTVSDGASGSDGSGCTTTENTDGTWTLTCGDGAPISLHDGTSGGACTVSGIAEGEYTISCPDGTTVTLRDGDDGDDGGCASAPVVAPRSVWFGALLIGMALLIRRRS